MHVKAQIVLLEEIKRCFFQIEIFTEKNKYTISQGHSRTLANQKKKEDFNTTFKGAHLRTYQENPLATTLLSMLHLQKHQFLTEDSEADSIVMNAAPLSLSATQRLAETSGVRRGGVEVVTVMWALGRDSRKGTGKYTGFRDVIMG